MKKVLKNSIIAIIVVLAINYLAGLAFTRFDLTQDQRYTLSDTSKEILAAAKNTLMVDIFLAGDFPDEFNKLQEETRQLLEEYEAVNSNINFNFINPVVDGKNTESVAQEFVQRGMRPEQVQVRDNGKTTQEIFFPWAVARYQNKTVRIPLLKKTLGASPDELVSRSVQNLEYAFSDGFYKVLNPKSKRVAVLKGNGELQDGYIADFFATLRESYFIAPFPLDSIAEKPETVLNALQKFDLIVAAKPTKPFTDAQKLALDQYTMNGGKSLWLLDAVNMETDSLYNETGTTLAFPRELNLRDMFFQYGVRINPSLVEDLYAAPIVLATGEANESSYSQLPWFYYPRVTSDENHPINTNIDNPIRLRYASPMDTLNNGIDKTVLLHTSQLSKVDGTPKVISLEEVTAEPNPQEYGQGPQILSVLLEGKFTSVYKDRIRPEGMDEIPFRESAIKDTKMIVVADGDIIKNDLGQNGQPLETGFDRFTYTQYGNKEFLLNAVNYLLDDSGLINIRSKDIALPALDPQRAIEERSTWQALMLGLPLALLAIFATVFILLRKRRYN